MIKLNKLIQGSLVAIFALSLAVPTLAASGRYSIDNSTDTSTSEFSDWGIRQFDDQIKINADSKIDVTETITADFTNAFNKHGLLRNIPVSYEDKNYQRMNLRFKLLSVTDEKGTPYDVETSHNGDDIDLKIGSADTLVSGEVKTYVIKYQLDRGINTFPDHDELYWNVTGNGWDVPITKSTTTVTIPEGANTTNLKAICYTGTGYSTEQNCTSEVVDAHTFRYTTTQSLGSSEGISIVAAFPTSLVTFPSFTTYLIWFFQDNWPYGLPVLVFLFMVFQWYTKGRDPKASHPTVMPEYEAPDKLTPAELGTLLDDNVDTRDITSTLIDLATRGYLRIIERKEKKFLGETLKYSLEPLRSEDLGDLKDFEQKLYNGIFDYGSEKVELDDLKYKFYKQIPLIETSIYAELIAKKYYTSNPKSVRTAYAGFGGSLAFITLFFLGFLTEFSVALYLGLIISGAIIFAFSFIMPRKTQKGVDTYIHILGMEEFIKTAEKDRLKFYEKENIFEKMLPYAIAFGLADKWAKACEGIFKNQPSWYSSSDPNMISNFNTFYFLNSLDSFNNSLGSTLTSAPRSSASGGSSGFGGGGFSGGGFGGGGGGSW